MSSGLRSRLRKPLDIADVIVHSVGMEAEIRLDEDLRERIDQEILHRVDVAVRDSAERDRELLRLREALKGNTQEVGSEPWPGACTLSDPMLREHHSTVVAAMVSQLRQPPYWVVEAVEPGSEATSAVIEGWLSSKAAQAEYGTVLYEAAYNAAAYRFAPIYVGWVDEVSKTRKKLWRDVETEELVAEGQKQPDREYEEADVLEQSLLGGRVYFEAVQPWDFYLSPANARKISEAQCVIQRIPMTREALLDGVHNLNFEKDAVMKIVTSPPIHSMNKSIKAEMDRNDGITSTDTLDNPIECYVVYGRLPLLLDNDEITTPEHLLNEDFVWWVCPDAAGGVVFKFAPWELPMRPYATCSILPEPGSFVGDSVLTMLREISEEATIMMRLMINSANLEIAPVIVGPKNREHDFDSHMTFPGAYLGELNGGELRPFQWDMRGPGLAMQQLEYLDSRASQLVATRNYGSVGSGKVRKATEIQAAESLMASKFDLFLQNFQQPGLTEIAKLLIMYYVAKGGVETQDGVEVTQELLDARYRFTPHASTGSADPQTRMAMTNVKIGAQSQYHQRLVQGMGMIAQQVMPTDMVMQLLSQAYHGARRALEDTGERDVESWIGKDPIALIQQAGQQDQMQQMLMAQQQAQTGAGQGAVQGEPGAESAGVGGPTQFGAGSAGEMQ